MSNDDHPFAAGIKEMLRENKSYIRHRDPRNNIASDYYVEPKLPSWPYSVMWIVAIASILIPLVVVIL